MFSLRRGLGVALLVILGALAILALPGPAHAAGCPDQPLDRTFRPWLDPAWYTPAPNGGLESGAAGWTLERGAAVVPGNEPFHVGGSDDASSLALPPGGSATTAPVCIGVEHPTIGRLEVAGAPYHFDGEPVRARHAPPLLGEQTKNILAELGYSAEEIAALVESGAAQSSEG